MHILQSLADLSDERDAALLSEEEIIADDSIKKLSAINTAFGKNININYRSVHI